MKESMLKRHTFYRSVSSIQLLLLNMHIKFWEFQRRRKKFDASEKV
jgi:hypothetical protein